MTEPSSQQRQNPPTNNNNNNDNTNDQNHEEEEQQQTGIKTATVDMSTLPLDWTKMGVGNNTNDSPDDHQLPIRYPHDVIEWTSDDIEVYSVGTAGQKITLLGDDFADPSKTNPELQTLVLRSHLIKDMAGLGTLTKLQLLELYDNMVPALDEESLKGCGPSLQTLDMSYNAIRDMSPVRFCATDALSNNINSNLTELYLANNKLKEIAGLSGLVQLKKLDLGANRIRVMNPHELGGLINLEELWIGKNKIEVIQGLEKLTKLRRLDVQSNRLTKIENLETQTKTLEELYLAHNGIDDEGASQASGLAQIFPNLTVLDLSRNQLTTTAPFAHLTALEELWLSGNEMQDFDAVVPLKEASAQMDSLETLYLEYNPLASDFEYRKKLAEWIPSLKQIDATMIGGRVGPAAYGVVGMQGTIGGGGAPAITMEERLRQLQEAAIERAKQETKGIKGDNE
ncbi:leucine rich repeat LRR-containing protein [Nitzschia inconspicua]|uniref:Leucine rich repeat LRR-containing protein n=1 Tax=Nitzschia inconspicua TaxID=303405 RepID=A0A9K3LI56_9STRA|nr:leucine rich repeat LRR-containing protein [Nitzschia inconspicua]